MDKRLGLIYSRRSVRSFKTEPVDSDLIKELLEAAMAAPSAKNRQPWRFVVVTDRLKREELAEAVSSAAFAKESPVVIIVCAEKEGELYDQDASAATQNILLAAAGLGLGTCWCGMTTDRRPQVHEIVGIPEDVHITSMICLGYPNELKDARTQYDPFKVYWGSYGQNV